MVAFWNYSTHAESQLLDKEGLWNRFYREWEFSHHSRFLQHLTKKSYPPQWHCWCVGWKEKGQVWKPELHFCVLKWGATIGLITEPTWVSKFGLGPQCVLTCVIHNNGEFSFVIFLFPSTINLLARIRCNTLSHTILVLQCSFVAMYSKPTTL